MDSNQGPRAFTIPEVMLAMTVCSLVMLGLISTHIFGLNLFQVLKPKVCANEGARLALNLLVGDVRAANRVRIGQGNSANFTEVAPGLLQRGNALELYPTSDTNTFVRYYCDQTDQKLKRTASGSSLPRIIASCVTNSLVFTSENCSGQVLTNNQNNRVIGLTLQFYQIQYPKVDIGPGQIYDFYQVHAKVSRRAVL